ncbi:MAG TPA: protein kinase [Planctomycetota bacterium]|nr:protein kinase [Planctomycetota bacterium]
MSGKPDILLGRIGLREGLITQEQLYDCLLFQERNPSRPLGSIMIHRGYVTQEQLENLLKLQKKAVEEAAAKNHEVARTLFLGKVLIDKGLATEYQVNECLRLQARMTEMGISPIPPLGEIMVKRGYIDREKLDTALMLQTTEFYTCIECGKPIEIPKGNSESYECSHCKAKIPLMFAKMAAALFTGLEKSADELDIELPAEVRERMSDTTNHFGKYVLLQEIGRGGAGVVWRAWQKDLNKTVALKILSHESQTAAGVDTPYGDAEDIKRFYNEIRAAADLAHENIVPILDFGIEQNHFYYAMKYIEGTTVDALATMSPRPSVDTSLRIIQSVCRALSYAHSKGIYHRDIKPSNIIVDINGKPWVMDFGLAKIVHMGDPAYVKGVIMGTPYYMPPEQASGDMEKVDAFSDIYSLGAVLYELATGHCPFADKSPETVVNILEREPPIPPRQHNPQLDVSVEKVIRKAMMKEKHLRYPSCDLLGEDLDRCLRGEEPIHVEKVTRRSVLDLFKSFFRR